MKKKRKKGEGEGGEKERELYVDVLRTRRKRSRLLLVARDATKKKEREGNRTLVHGQEKRPLRLELTAGEGKREKKEE